MKEIKLGEQTFYVRFGFNAYSIFGEVTGKGLNDMATLDENLTIKDAIGLVYAGLKDGARKEKVGFDMQVEDVADLMDDYPELLTKVMEAFADSQPAESKNLKALPKKAKG